MLISRQLQGVPDASAQPGASMTITRTEDGVTVGTALTDGEGIATVQTNGSPGPIKTLFTKGNRWQDDSRSIMPVGSMEMCDLRDYIKFLHTNGIILGYGSSFAITSSGSGNALISTGAVVLDGVLSVHAAAETISIANGDIAIVVKQMHTNGRTQLTAIDYADLGSSTNVPLWRCTVSGGSISGTPTWIATPTLYGIVQRRPTVMSIVRTTSGSTTNASGEDGGLSTSITLVTGIVYDITASASVISRARHGAIAVKIDGTLGTYQSNGGDRTVKLANASSKAAVTGAGATSVLVFDKSETALTDWVLQATYGSFGSGTSPNFDSPRQTAVNSAGKIYVADSGNNRLVRLNTDGTYDTSITGLTAIPGVCVDASDNVYVAYNTSSFNYAMRKYNSSLVLQWDTNPTSLFSTARHLATDGTSVFVNHSVSSVRKYNATTGALVTSFGSAGSGNGQFALPYVGLVQVGEVYVVDAGSNDRVQVFDTSGVYQRQWAIPSGSRGITADSSGRVMVANTSGSAVYRYTTVGVAVDSFSQTSPEGVAVASGDVVWVSNGVSHNVAKWDETASAFNWDSGLLVVRAVPRT